jgi:hypothetical protein
MAVVKANFVKRDRRAKERAKATVRYIQSRPGKDGEKLTRDLFGPDGTLTRDQAFKMIDEAKKGTIFYRLVLSPDPNSEDTLRDLDLRNLTTALMLRLEERLKTEIPFAASVHSDHSPHRHVHIVALLVHKLTQQDLSFLRNAAAEAILQQRRLRELVQTQSRGRGEPEHQPVQTISRRERTFDNSPGSGEDGGAPGKPVQTCPLCSDPGGLPMHRLSANIYRCASCGLVLKQTVTGMQIERLSDSSLGIGRSLL